MRLIKEENKYIADCTFEEKDIAKTAGFRFDWEKKQWWASDAPTAYRLIEYADEDVRAELEAWREEREQTIEQSKAVDLDVDIPAPDGFEYLPYQKAGIAFAGSRPNVLIGDEMGLGKTIQALGAINVDPSIKKVLIVCPASLRLNWQREAEKWLTRPMTIGIADTKRGLPDTDIVIINYDILSKKVVQDGFGKQEGFDLLIGDEVHYAKNPKAQRSKAFYAIGAKRRIYLTGTPITNRPKELFPIVNSLAPDEFPSFWKYAHRYCGAFNNGWGWNFDGATNLEELQDRLRSTVMVRRLKADVLTELPPKRRQVIELPALSRDDKSSIKDEQNLVARYKQMVEDLRVAVELAKASDDPADYENAVSRLRDARREEFTAMARLRHQTALTKVPYVIEHTLDIIDADPDYKVVIMCHHHDVVARLKERFGSRAVVLTGEVSLEDRQKAVDTFQTDPEVQVFIGGIQSAGVGITLTASAHVIFAELDWVPANMAQAEDRVHRIGQVNSVLIQHLVLEDSLDARMAHTLVKKMDVIDKALDREHDKDTLHALSPEEAKRLEEEARERKEESDKAWATKSATASAIAEEAVDISPAEVELVHNQLRFMSARCDGAHELDGQGFNALDTRIGKSLANLPKLTPKQAVLGRKILSKYKAQLAEAF